MKKILSLACVAILTICMSLTAGCNNGNANKDDVLRVGMECAYQPYNWTQLDNSNGAVAIKGRNGQYANGYDVKIAQKIAEGLNKTLEIYAYEWGSLISAVQSGALDLIIAGMSPTAERLEKVDFSDPYLESDLVIVVRKDGAYASATSITDFSGAKIVAQAGTFHDEVVDQISGVNHVTALADFPTMITALKSGTVDGYIAERPGATADCNGNSEFKFIDLKNNENGFTVEDLSNVTIAVGIKKGSELTAKVNEILRGISEESRLQLMVEALEQAPVNG